MVQEVEKCEEVRDLLYLFVCQELEADDIEMVVRHLATCSGCQEALVQHGRLTKHLGKAIAGVPVNYVAYNA